MTDLFYKKSARLQEIMMFELNYKRYRNIVSYVEICNTSVPFYCSQNNNFGRFLCFFPH